MRKYIYTLGCLLGLAAFISCSKDYTCSCEIEYVTTNGQIEKYTRDYTLKDSKKSWAKDRCVSTIWSEPEITDDSMGFPITYPGYTETTTCELK